MIETLLFIRHAETDFAGRFCGHSDPPVNERGRRLLEEVKMRIIELAAGVSIEMISPRRSMWRSGLARALVTGRAPFEAMSALAEIQRLRIAIAVAEQESRADLRTEMAGLDWFLGVVDLRLLLAFQRADRSRFGCAGSSGAHCR